MKPKASDQESGSRHRVSRDCTAKYAGVQGALRARTWPNGEASAQLVSRRRVWTQAEEVHGRRCRGGIVQRGIIQRFLFCVRCFKHLCKCLLVYDRHDSNPTVISLKGRMMDAGGPHFMPLLIGTPLDEYGSAWARVGDSINRFSRKDGLTYINRHLPEKDTRASISNGTAPEGQRGTLLLREEARNFRPRQCR